MEERVCCLHFERVLEKDNQKIMLECEKVAEGVLDDGREFSVVQSKNRNVITIIFDGFYNHVILKEIISKVLSESEALEPK